MRIRMKLISEQAGADDPIIDEGTAGDPVSIHGSGPHSFICGGCGTMLAEGMRFGQVESVSFRCAACGALNAAPRVMGGDSASDQ
jgi:hypothetical protein